MKAISKSNLALVILIIASLGIGQSCSGNHENHDHNKKKSMKKSDQQQEKNNSGNQDHHGNANPVKLNDGKKWEANPATTEGIKNMRNALKESNGMKKMHEKLLKEFNTIFEKCTMKGEAHNQLHNYLLPLKNQLDNLKNCQNDDSCEKIITTIEQHLNKYPDYFK